MTIHTTEGMQVPDFVPTIDIEGGTVFLTCKEGDRLSIATTIERLIAMLDAMDGDENLEEPGDREPVLGWPNAGQPANRGMCEDDDREMEESDAEPSLGAAEHHPGAFGFAWLRPGELWRDGGHNSQGHWAAGASDDREDDGDDLEPSLGGVAKSINGKLEYDFEQDGCDDEPNGDYEPSMGWGEVYGQGPRVGSDISSFDFVGDDDDTVSTAGLHFDGSGHDAARDMLRDLRVKGTLPDPDQVFFIAPGVMRIGY